MSYNVIAVLTQTDTQRRERFPVYVSLVFLTPKCPLSFTLQPFVFILMVALRHVRQMTSKLHKTHIKHHSIKDTPYMFYHYPHAPNFSQFHSTGNRFWVSGHLRQVHQMTLTTIVQRLFCNHGGHFATKRLFCKEDIFQRKNCAIFGHFAPEDIMQRSDTLHRHTLYSEWHCAVWTTLRAIRRCHRFRTFGRFFWVPSGSFPAKGFKNV